MNKSKVFLVPVHADFCRLILNFYITLYPYQKAPVKLKSSMSYPPSANNFEHPMPCRPCRTHEASFLEDLVPPSKLVCHIPLQLITLKTPSSGGPVTGGQFFRRPCLFFFFFFFFLLKWYQFIQPHLLNHFVHGKTNTSCFKYDNYRFKESQLGAFCP